MTVKQFVKSKTFKCILVLLCIALVSGALLSILNDLLKVTEEERVSRTIKGIYGTEVKYEVVDTGFSTEKGKVESVYRLQDGNYLIKSTGYEGYKQGTVTVWLVAYFTEGVYTGIDNVQVADYEKQTLMSKFTDKELAKYKGKEDSYKVIVGGATKSSNAINNAVNTAVSFIRNELVKEGGAE